MWPGTSAIADATDRRAQRNLPTKVFFVSVDKSFPQEVSVNFKETCLTVFIACLLAPSSCRGGKHHTTITWERSTHPDIVGFNIYRGDDPGKENPVPVAKLVASECCTAGTLYCQWDDYDVVRHAKHCYIVKSVLKGGKALNWPRMETCAVTP